MILGLDIGTTAVKGILLDREAKIVATAEEPHRLFSAFPGWAEEDPLDWWRGAVKVISSLTAQHDGEIRAIGVSGMVPAIVLLDRDQRPIRLSVQQNDARAVEDITWFQQLLPDDALFAQTGSVWNAQSVAPKLRWLKRYEPEAFARVRRICGSYEFVTMRLTGERYTEANWALESGLWDPHRRVWIEPILETLELSPDAFSPIRAAHEIVGSISAEAALETGLMVGIPVIAGSADHIAAALAAGLEKPGDIVFKIGGAGDVLYVTNEFSPIRELFIDYHLLPHRFVLNGCMATSGSLIKWFQQVFRADVSLEALDNEAALTPAGSLGLLCLPYFLGEKTPIHDPQARGTLVGLTLTHSSAHVYRSLLEGVAFAFRHHIEILLNYGHPIQRCFVMDGGARSPLWRSILASVLGRDLERLESGAHGSAFGVAFLAGSAIRYWPLESISEHVNVVGVTTPNRNDQALYDVRYGVYRELYTALKPLFPKMEVL